MGDVTGDGYTDIAIAVADAYSDTVSAVYIYSTQDLAKVVWKVARRSLATLER